VTPPAVVLDIDGTLVDTNYQHALTWHRAFRQSGLVVPVFRTHRAIGMGGDILVPALAGEEWEAEHGDDVRAVEKALYMEMIDQVEPLPGARDFLEWLNDRGHPVVLSSSAKAEEAEAYLDKLEARDLVTAWTTSADVERTKPEPDVVHAALDKLSDEQRQGAVMVGDSVYDVQAAAKAGLPTIAVLTGGFGADELRGEGAAHVFDGLPELMEGAGKTPLSG
jgi:HAD superfamily hydrolase (TIGR01509 family)